jgi:HAD superfamily phosphatase
MSFPVRGRPGALEALAKAGLFVLDVDGVLLDPKPSFYRAAKETARWAASHALDRDPGAEITDDEIAAFKASGGWNDDFELACGCAWALVVREARSDRRPVAETARRTAGGGLAALLRDMIATLSTTDLLHASEACSPEKTRSRAATLYAGRSRCRAMYGLDPALHPDLPEDGLWSTEAVLASGFLLRALGGDLAFFTGRNGPEAALALERLEIEVRPELRVVDDGACPRKPAPEGLVRLAHHAGGRSLAFVGDSIDDQHAALSYRELAPGAGLPPVVFARVLLPDAGEAEIAAALEAGADVVTPGLDALLEALPRRHRRDDE